MSWHWSRLSTLALLALLYASPLSSGDKGLWLSVTSMPVLPFGALPGAVPPEHSILLPHRDNVAVAQACVEPGEPSLSLGPVDAGAATSNEAWTTVVDRATWRVGEVCPVPTAPRGPPA